MDGWVVIGTKLDNKQFERDLRIAERKLKLYEKEAEKLTKTKTKAEIDLRPYEEQKRLIQEATDEMLTYSQTEKEVNNQLNIEKTQLEELNQKYSKQLNNLNDVNNKIKENTKNQELWKNEIENIKKKTNGMNIDFDKIGNSTSNVIRKVSKWALAVFSIRSAYMLIRKSMSTLSQYNDNLANKLESIQLVIASALEPIVTRIVDLVYKLLYYLNYIIKAWFKIDLFSSANDKALKSGAKSAEKMKKSLAGFDEMNILQDNSSPKNGISIPKIEDSDIPSWVKWIAKNKDLLLDIGKGLAAAFALTKISGWLNNLGLLFTGKYGLGDLKTTLGNIGIIAGGIAITSIVAKKVWDEAQELKNEIRGIREAGTKGQEEWIKKEENINDLITTGNVNRKAGYDLLGKVDGILYKITGLGEENLETAKQVAVNVGKQVDKEMEIYNTGKLNNDQKQSILDNIKEQIKYNENLIIKLKEQGIETDDIETSTKTLMENANTIYQDVNNTSESLYDINNLKLTDKGFKVRVDVEKEEAENKLKSFIEKVKKGIELVIKGNFSIGTGNAGGSGGGRGFAKGGIVYHNLPKLASGGIINIPGRGVPIGSAIGGERGKEGVIPLTDSQQMELLGSTIGKYININFTNITKLDNRQIAKEQKKINAQNDFAFNR